MKRSAEDLVAGVLSGDRALLGQAITMVESTADRDADTADAILDGVKRHTGGAFRIGVTGAPGAGKSTFIEAMGTFLLAQGHRVAVLAVDPSSTRTGGSILGDRTRMEGLSRDERCFIRPVPSCGVLGGVARSTLETMMLCEAAGFDVVLVETVGVGQSEVAVRDLVDCSVLLLLPNAGDSLQGIKRGIMEISDVVVIHKADGELMAAAGLARLEIEGALSLLQPATPGWKTPVLTASSVSMAGREAVGAALDDFAAHVRQSGGMVKRRSTQMERWFHTRLAQRLTRVFFQNPRVTVAMPEVLSAFVDGRMPLSKAIDALLTAGGLQQDGPESGSVQEDSI